MNEDGRRMSVGGGKRANEQPRHHEMRRHSSLSSSPKLWGRKRVGLVRLAELRNIRIW
jgi:hypothetical protein